jgi:hypothetical protein
MNYRYVAVIKTPTPLDHNVVYVNEEFELATLLCPCGCGHKITLLCPDGHTVKNDDGFATVSPSIGVWDRPCRSHFCLTRGRIAWCRSWSDHEIKISMDRQLQRHIETKEYLKWYQKFGRLLAKFRIWK